MSLLDHTHAPASRTHAAPDRLPVVCQVVQTSNIGGAEILALRIAQAQRGRFRAVFACLDGDGPLIERLERERFPLLLLDKRPGIDLNAARRLRRFLKAESVDLIHAHQCGPFIYSALARLPRPKPSILLTEHGRHFPDVVGRQRRIVNRLLLRRDDRVVAVGDDVRRALIENENFPASRIEVVYNGIDLDLAGSVAPERDAVRRELGIKPDEFAVTVCARLDPIKDHATTLRAFQRLTARHPDSRLLVVGDGPERDVIASDCESLGLGDRVLRLGLRSDIPRLLAASDAAILTSHSEGIPLFLIEAMAARLPVVATRVGGIPEVVEDGFTGRLAPRGDVDALAAHLCELAARPDLRASMGGAGLTRAEALFAESRMLDEYRALYESMSGVRHPRAVPLAVGGP